MYNKFDLATEQDLAREAYEKEMARIYEAQKEGVVLLTSNGFVEGHFVGSVEYAVGGDAETGWETDMMLAFRKKNGRIVGASRNIPYWDFYSIKELGGVIHWGRYPDELPEEKRSAQFFAPKPVEHPHLSNFVDHPERKDAGDFLYVVKVWKSQYGTEIYAGHNRNVAAKKLKEMRALSYRCTAIVYPVHRQDEYNFLPF